MAGFVNMTYDFTDQISLEAGGRYTWDKRGQILRQNYLGGGSPTFGGAGTAFGAPSTNFMGSATTPSSRRAPRSTGGRMPTTRSMPAIRRASRAAVSTRAVGVNAPAG
jgi:iron complex outermembrane receptor protein